MVLLSCQDIKVSNRKYLTAFSVFIIRCFIICQVNCKHRLNSNVDGTSCIYIYIHCFNHRLHLALRMVMEETIELENFFSDAHVAKLYQGQTPKALITTRWCVHFSAIKTIRSSYTEPVDCLVNVTTPRALYSCCRKRSPRYMYSVSHAFHVGCLAAARYSCSNFSEKQQ